MTETPTTPEATFASYPVARWEFVLQAAETDCRERYPDSAFRGMVDAGDDGLRISCLARKPIVTTSTAGPECAIRQAFSKFQEGLA